MSGRVLLIPAYQEAERLGAVLEAVARAGVEGEVVVVDDGSRDATAEVARGAGARLLRHPWNLGYGAALQTGYKYALERGASFLVQLDADGQHDAADIPALLAPVERGECDLVVGSRFLGHGEYRMGALRALGRRLFQAIARGAGLHLSDPTSGFQAMNRRVLEVYARDFFPTDYPDLDVLLTAWRDGLRVGERPVRMRPGTRASTLHGGLRSVYYVYKMLLSTFSVARRRAQAAAPEARRP
jgi:glycosyltransferase involved in cell wall biosynthesis